MVTNHLLNGMILQGSAKAGPTGCNGMCSHQQVVKIEWIAEAFSTKIGQTYPHGQKKEAPTTP